MADDRRLKVLSAIVTDYVRTRAAGAQRFATDLLDRFQHLDPDDGTPAPLVRFVRSADFLAAVDIVTMRRLGDSLAFSRRGSPGPIAVLEAASNACYALAHRPADPVAPEVRFA